MSEEKGKVYLVGAGPGDSGLFTLRGKEVLKRAQVVIYDSLVNPDILRFCNSEAELIFAGKAAGKTHISQRVINELLISKALEGKTVARLKGGDPFVFGRGGEEAEVVIKSGIPIEIVPGVSSITAVPAYAGIPVTHREYNSSFAVFTGHQSQGEDFDCDPARIETMIFLMGLHNIEYIMNKLISLGREPSTPVAVISCGTLPEQLSVFGTLCDISEKIEGIDLQTPATIVVGKIASVSRETGWYQKKPLFGKTVMVTREKKAAAKFARLLGSCGARTVEFPTIETSPIRATRQQKLSIDNTGKYDFLIFTSANGVSHYFDMLASNGKDSRNLGGKKIISIGEKTSQELSKYNVNADYLPESYTAEGIASLAENLNVKDKKILIPRALEAREFLPSALRRMGASVEVLPVYETLVPEYGEEKLRTIKRNFKAGQIDLVTFTSSSTVTNFFSLLGKNPELFRKTRFACIGPITAATLEDFGFAPAAIADIHTTQKLKAEIVRLYGSSR